MWDTAGSNWLQWTHHRVGPLGTYLRKDKNCWTASSVCERNEDDVREATLQDNQGQKRKGRKCSRCWRRDSPAAPGEDHAGTGRDSLKELCLWRTHAGAVSEGLQIVGKTHAGARKQCEEEVIAERNYHGLTTTPVPFPLPCLG